MNITSKYRSLSVQAKAALWFTICSFLQKGISFITVPIFTRLMSTEEYGTYTVYLSWLQILTIMTSLYLFNGVYDNAMAKYEKQRDEYTSTMQGLTLAITGAVFALYCFTSGFWEKILNLPKSMILLMFLEALLSPALSYWSGRQRFEYRYRILVCVTILQALMNPIASLVLIRINGGTAMMRILGIVGVQVCICVPIIVFQFCKGKRVLLEGILGLRTADRNSDCAALSVRHYSEPGRPDHDRQDGRKDGSCAVRTGVQHRYAGAAFHQWYEQCADAVDVQQDQKGDIRSMRKVLQLLGIVVVGIAVALMLISPELVLIFGSPKYREAVYVIPPVAASVFFIFIYNILSMPQFYYEKTQFLMAASMAAAGANVVLNFIFIRLFGYIAAGYTTLACYMLYSVGHYIVSKRILVNEGIQENLMNPGFLVACSVFLIGASIICNLIFPYRILRYAILLASAGLVFWKKELLLKTMADIRKKKKVGEDLKRMFRDSPFLCVFS